MIERGVAYSKTKETDLCWSATVETGSCSSGGVWRTAKRDSTGYCSSPPSTPSSLHELLFIHRRPPPASTCDCSSTGSCSSSLPRKLLHLVPFNQPSPRATVHPALHHLLFILPSMGWSYSYCPPRGRVHPAPTGSNDRGPVHPPPPGTVHPNPLSNTHCSSRGSIARLQLAAVAKESLDRSGSVTRSPAVQSLGFS